MCPDKWGWTIDKPSTSGVLDKAVLTYDQTGMCSLHIDPLFVHILGDFNCTRNKEKNIFIIINNLCWSQIIINTRNYNRFHIVLFSLT